MKRTSVIMIVVAAIGIGAGVRGLVASGSSGDGEWDPVTEAMFQTVAFVPVARYDAIVVSPTIGVEQGVTAQFMLRAADSNGTVQDFVFHVPSGETTTISFPQGWAVQSGSFLYAFTRTRFSAWGITPQGLVRFEPIDPEPNKDATDRARLREWERLLRTKNRRD